MNLENLDYELLAFEGIDIDFQFNTEKLHFGDLFLIVGIENPNFPSNNKEIIELQSLGFEQVDDYFGIRNNSNLGSDVKIWLFPIINGEEVYHNHGPYDSLRLSYIVVKNTPNTIDIFEKSFNQFSDKLDVTPKFNGETVIDFNEIKTICNNTIKYCREELKVEPGSEEAIGLEW